ncbi:MAG: hypothetical protein WCF08_08860 [Anaerolineaceae bacterium]
MPIKALNRFFSLHQNRIVLLLILSAAVVGVAGIINATPFGPGVGSDAVVYITSARNLLAGRGLGLVEPDGAFRLLPYFPPFYPLALSALGLFVKDLVSGARWMNALLFGGLITVMGYAFYRYTRSGFFAVVLGWMLAFSTVLINVSVWAMSEPVSLFVGFAGLIFLLIFLDNQKHRYFILSALFTGLAFLSRYASVAFCLTGCLVLMLFVHGNIGRKIGKAVQYGVIALLPMVIWFVIDVSMTGTLGSRSSQNLSDIPARAVELILPLKVAFYEWTPFVLSVSRWIKQPYFRIGLMVIALVITWVVIRAVKSIRQSNQQDSIIHIGLAFIVTMGIFGVFYLLMIAVTYIFTFPPITLSDRMFSPLIVAYLAIIAWLGFIITSGYRSWKWVRGLVACVMLLFMITYGLAAKAEIKEMSMDGLGYNAWVYRQSALIDYVKTIPGTTPLITNKAPMLLYFTGRSAYTVQEVFNPKEYKDFVPYGIEQNDEAQRVFREDGGALVLFNSIIDDFIGLYGEEQGWVRYNIFVQGLRSAYQADDGQVYYYP